MLALAVFGLNLCHTEDLQTNETKKDRHDGRSIIYNNVEEQRAGTEAEDFGRGSRLFIVYMLFKNTIYLASLISLPLCHP